MTIMGCEVMGCNTFNLRTFNLISTNQILKIYWHYERHKEDQGIVPNGNLRVSKK